MVRGGANAGRWQGEGEVRGAIKLWQDVNGRGDGREWWWELERKTFFCGFSTFFGKSESGRKFGNQLQRRAGIENGLGERALSQFGVLAFLKRGNDY